MNKSKLILSMLAVSLMAALPLSAQDYTKLSKFDENKPVGWCNIGISGGVTGSSDQNPVTVTTYEELRSALQKCKGGKSSATIYISGNIECPEKLRFDKCKNMTIYGLPGSSLYYTQHTDNADANPGFFCQNWDNAIFRNITIKGPGAYDISGADNMQFVESTHIWVDHCDIQDGMDGNLDAKTKADFLTISWCKFAYYIAPWANNESADHRCSSMWGSSNNRGDDEGHLNSTFVNCWWYHGCGQRCPRIRFGNVHVANCLWENGTTEDPAQYCIGVGHQSDMYIENGDFSGTVTSGPHIKLYPGEKKIYDYIVTGNIGEPDTQVMGADGPGTYYNPYTYDYGKNGGGTYDINVYPAKYVKAALTDADNGAGATLDEDLLTSRGNPNLWHEGTDGIQGVNAPADDARVVGIEYFNLNGEKLSGQQKGINLIRFQMSDGTTRTQKIMK